MGAPIKTLKKFIGRIRLRSLRYALNLLWYETFYYGRGGVLFYTYFPGLARRVRPRLFELEMTTRCTFKCVMCEHTYWEEPGRDVTLAQFKKVAEKFKGFVWCGLTGIGSSFLNRDFMPILRHVKEGISKDIFVELYDHFYFLDEEKARELIRLGIDFMLISMDGSNRQTYERIRAGSDFDTVVQNIERLIRLKADMSSFFPELAFHYIISKENLSDVPKFVEYAHHRFGGRNGGRAGWRSFKYIYFTAILHPFEEIRRIAVKVPLEIVNETEAVARRLGVPLIWNVNVKPDKPPIRECRAWIEPFIFSDGTVIPCCAGNEANRRDYQRKYALGNIFDQTLDEIWFGEKFDRFRNILLSGQTPVQCRFCPVRSVSSSNSPGIEKEGCGKILPLIEKRGLRVESGGV